MNHTVLHDRLHSKLREEMTDTLQRIHGLDIPLELAEELTEVVTTYYSLAMSELDAKFEDSGRE